MTERETASLLRAALQRRAEYGMLTTDTDRELHRLRGHMGPVRRRRRLRAGLAVAAAVAVVGGAVGLGLAVTSGNDSKTPVVTTKPRPTTLPSGTLPSGFPVGTYRHPGSAGVTTLKLTHDAQAVVSNPNGIAYNDLTFTTPNRVTFDTKGGAGCTTAGQYLWAVSNNQLVLTAVNDTCFDRRIALTEKPWGPIRRSSSS